MKSAKTRYCKYKFCNNGNNGSRKVLDYETYYRTVQYCCDSCFRLDRNLPLICQNPNCNNVLNRNHESFCSNSCSSKTKLTGRHLSEQHKKQVSLGIRRSDKYKQSRMRPEFKRPLIEYNQSFKDKKYSEIFGQEKAKSIKKKQRISALRHIQKTRGDIKVNVGKNEKVLLDKFEKESGCVLIRGYQIKELGYFVDGYCQEKNLVVEIYEKQHEKQKERDLIRQKEIMDLLKCEFIIIKDY